MAPQQNQPLTKAPAGMGWILALTLLPLALLLGYAYYASLSIGGYAALIIIMFFVPVYLVSVTLGSVNAVWAVSFLTKHRLHGRHLALPIAVLVVEFLILALGMYALGLTVA